MQLHKYKPNIIDNHISTIVNPLLSARAETKYKYSL